MWLQWIAWIRAQTDCYGIKKKIKQNEKQKCVLERTKLTNEYENKKKAQNDKQTKQMHKRIHTLHTYTFCTARASASARLTMHMGHFHEFTELCAFDVAARAIYSSIKTPYILIVFFVFDSVSICSTLLPSIAAD